MTADDGYLDDIARREGKAERLKRVLIALTAVLVIIAVGLLIWLVILIRDTQTANSPLVKQAVIQTDEIKGLAEQIQSCTDPKGECYQSGQRRTSEAIASINVITLYAAVCGPQVTADMPLEQRLSIVRDCVARLTQRHQP